MHTQSLYRISKLFEKLAFNNEIEQLFNYVKHTASKPPTDEQFNSWLHTNQTVINGISHYKWLFAPHQNELLGHKPNDTYYQNPEVIVSTHPIEGSDEMTTLSAGILRGVAPIPTLHITRVELEWKKDTEYPREIMHHEWLIGGVANMLKNRGLNYDFQELVAFIRFNEETLNKLRRQFEYSPVLLGAGSDGAAFQVGQTRVLKIFKDRSAYNAAIAAHKRLWDNPELARHGEAMIYDIGEFQYPLGDLKLYYYVMEYLPSSYDIGTPNENDMGQGIANELSALLSVIRDVMEEHRELFERLRRSINHPRASSYLKAISSKIVAVVRHRAKQYKLIRNIEKRLPNQLAKDWLEKLVEEIAYKYATGRTDLHSGNIGLQSQTGRFIYFDPAFEIEPEELFRI